MSSFRISVLDYLKYLDGSKNSRCVYEGEEVFHAGHVILCGRTDSPADEVHIFALCLQSSAISSDPHEIKGILKTVPPDSIQISQMLCSCKAGQGGRCKHISAVLLWCNARGDLNNIEFISQTDIKCTWTQQKHNTKEKYRAVPVCEIPCVKKQNESFFENVDGDMLYKFFIKNLPNSALAKHNAGRNLEFVDVTEASIDTQQASTSKNFNDQHIYQILLDHLKHSRLMKDLSNHSIDIKDCCAQKVKNLFNLSDAETTIHLMQHSQAWLETRKFRITGSRIYEIYTYNQDNWNRKSMLYFFPKAQIKNKYTSHGLRYEDDGRQAFIALTGFDVREFGIIVPKNNLWLGYSPDGVVFEDNTPVALLEIKCIFAGANSSIDQAIQSATFLKMENGEYVLRRKHKYFGQVVMGMSVLNVDKCYFVIYASFDGSMKIIEIKQDPKFAWDLLLTVKTKYYKNMVHTLCEQ